MNTKTVLSVVAIPLGVCAIILGGIDDSPGAQLLGLTVIVVSVVVAMRGRKK